jgi:hypothetical protein
MGSARFESSNSLYHALAKLPEPETTHDFSDESLLKVTALPFNRRELQSLRHSQSKPENQLLRRPLLN